MSEAVKWYVHVLGPDDLIEQPDELAALREANAVNRCIARDRNPDGEDPWHMAVAVTEADANEKTYYLSRAQDCGGRVGIEPVES